PAVLDELQKHLEVNSARRFKLVANLPYNIATPLVANLLALARPPEIMVITIQKELAERLAAPPSTRDYSALSIWVQCQCRVEILRAMPPDVFWPRPKVHSAIVRLPLDPERRAAVGDLDYFRNFVHRLFLHRRKVLRTVLAGEYKGKLDKPAVDRLMAGLQL